jgi:enterochelin esterase-like enzyme
MKSSLLLSVAAATLLQMGVVSAQSVIPSINVTPNECRSWAEALGDPTYKAHAQKRCRAIETCWRDQSDNQNDLRECLFAAESNFQRARAGVLPQGAEMGVETPVATEVADSAYDHPDRGKGWDFTDQGS